MDVIRSILTGETPSCIIISFFTKSFSDILKLLNPNLFKTFIIFFALSVLFSIKISISPVFLG